MTAEIAILNKLAVALATDSAVTISAGKQEEKIYDSADKLFDLSTRNPIGIMIYNGMQFMQAPLQVLISEYRSKSKPFNTVKEAAYDFLSYLDKWGADSPDAVLRASLERIIGAGLNAIRDRIKQKNEEAVDALDMEAFVARFKAIPGEVISAFENLIDRADDSKFIGGRTIRFTKTRVDLIADIVHQHWGNDDPEIIGRLVNLAKKFLVKDIATPSHTGIVISGFGEKEKFPSLISFTIDGIVFDHLKYSEINFVDIDRNGDRARVIPFAQKEMVERFLYGLDSNIERQITIFCKQTVPEIRNQILAKLEMPEADQETLMKSAQDAERAFIEDLQNKRFEEIRSSSRSEIEGMVEFMPKPELAKMAEALVNLTSIKRRVSRGMETVGGPIDVAVISRTEGFIWVKRKHYFSTELNPRYLSRINSRENGAEDG
ncbi:hypothetical protein [Rhizobium leguminosarum]|uniref:hypothetical protein n=1 Tax=Rhizobium leguminosarum TaxID=384 RepID=UPI00103D9ACD|nr:hypothetical protein [Rhizobium leguminosarum]TBZ06236.1 hypothetical protein E0H33_34050 [Rhizobium leguminosarum bv. viciae]